MKSTLSAWTPRGVFALSMLCTGAAGLMYEYVLSVVFTHLLGGSIEQFSITIGVMFFTMGLGLWAQSRVRDNLAECFIVAELLLVMFGGFSPLILQWAYTALPEDFAWIKVAYPALIGLLTGMEIPLIVRINEKFAKNLESNIAGTWAWDYIGGALGVVVWVWLLKSYVPLMHISFLVAGCNLLVAIVTLVFFWRRKLFKTRNLSSMVLGGLSMAVAASVFVGWVNAGVWSQTLVQKLYDNPVVLHEQTPYQDIVITEGPHPTDSQGKNVELYLNGNKQFASSDEAIYHEYLVHPAMSLAAVRGRVLILGGGDGMALREVLKYPDVRDVTLVDLDPGMIKLARDNAVLKELNDGSFSDARVHSSLDNKKLRSGVVNTGKKQDVMVDTGESKQVDCDEVVDKQGRGVNSCDEEPVLEKTATVDVFNIDADRFLSGAAGLYDVVIVDLPDPNSVELGKLYSKEFYGKIRRAMSPDGMVVVQATSPYHAKETFLCILRTMTAAGLNVVPYHDNVPSFGDWGWLIGSPSLSEEELFTRLDALEHFPAKVKTREVDAPMLSRALLFGKGWLTSRHNEVSTLMNPVVYSYYTYEAWRVD